MRHMRHKRAASKRKIASESFMTGREKVTDWWYLWAGLRSQVRLSRHPLIAFFTSSLVKSSAALFCNNSCHLGSGRNEPWRFKFIFENYKLWRWIELTVSGGEVLSNIIELSTFSYQVHLYGSCLSVNYIMGQVSQCENKNVIVIVCSFREFLSISRTNKKKHFERLFLILTLTMTERY